MATTLDDMLAAAEAAAGANWNTIRGDLQNFAKNLVQDSAQTAADFAAGAITAEDVKVQLEGLEDQAAIIKNYAVTAVKEAAQDAINAALGVLLTAITHG